MAREKKQAAEPGTETAAPVCMINLLHSNYVWVKYTGTDVEALNLIDTGAQVSILPKSLYDALPEAKRPPLKPCRLNIMVGNGSSIKLFGTAKIEFEFEDMQFCYEMHVVEDTVDKPILGYDFLHDTGDSKIVPSSHAVIIRGKRLKLADRRGEQLSHKVNVMNTVIIPAGKELNITGIIRGKGVIDGSTRMLEPVKSVFPKTGALVSKVIVSPSRGQVPVRVFNPHDEPLVLFKNTALGLLQQVDRTSGWREPSKLVDYDEMPNLLEVESDIDSDVEDDDDVLTPMETEKTTKLHVGREAGEKDQSVRRNTDPQAYEGYDADESCVDDEAQRRKEKTKMNEKIVRFAALPTKEDGEVDYVKLPDHMQNLYETSIKELNRTQRTSLKKLLYDYADIFARDSNDIGKATNIKHHIDTANEDPVVQKPRRQAKAHTEEIQKQVRKLHEAGIIRPSESEWASNVVMAKKKDGTWRMCIDYRELNTKTKNKGTYMLPRIDETLDSLSRAKFFCSLDIIQGYHHIELSDESKPKTAFHAPKCNPSHWEYNYMPFGLVGAPRTFQRMMDRILRGLEYKIALAYLDDIIIYGATIEECLANMTIVFERIRQAGLKLKPSKCSLFQQETMFLGHVISAEGIRTDPKKVEDVMNMKPCRNVKDVQTFMGMANYYSRFVPNFHEISLPIQDLTRKGVKFRWAQEQQAAFDEIKRKLSTAPVLAYPRDDCKYVLDTDASDYALGAVLSQLQPDGCTGALVERPIAYFSRKFSDTEAHYCARRRELLAIVRSVQHFDPYIRGQDIIIRTDHASLRYIKTTKELPSQMHRWAMIMEDYTYTIEVRKGTLHANADAMSRMPCKKKICICDGIDRMEHAESVEDRHVARVTLNALWYKPKYTLEEMAAAQRADPDIGPLYRAKVDENKRPAWNEISGESPAAKAYMCEWRRVEVHDKVLYRRWENDDATEIRLQLIVPFKYQREMCKNYHDAATKAHLGRRRCYASLQRFYFWHKMHDDVKWWIRTCDKCQRRKRPQPTPRAPMRVYVTGHPGERLSMDIVGPIEMTERGNQFLLCITDHFSKFAKAIPLPRHTAAIVAEELTTKWFNEYGEPMQIHTDQGAEFESQLMKELMNLLGIEKCRTVAFKPSSDGLIERYNKTIVDCISMVRQETNHWDLVVGKCVSAYNSTIHATTGFTPNKLWLGREVYHNADLMMPQKPEEDKVTTEQYVQRWENDMRLAYRVARETIGRNVKIQKKYYDRSCHLVKYKEGDAVMLKDYSPKVRGTRKLADKWVGPWYVLDVLSDINFRIIKDENSKPKVVHHDRMKKYHHRGEKPDVSWVIARSRSAGQIELSNSKQKTDDVQVSNDVSKAMVGKPRRELIPPVTADPAIGPSKPTRGRPRKKILVDHKEKHIKIDKSNEIIEKKPRGRPPKCRKAITPPHPAPMRTRGSRFRGRPPEGTAC